MELLITISNQKCDQLLEPLLQACRRRSCNLEVFLTHEGVQVLNNPSIVKLLQETNTPAVTCHDSWVRHCEHADCPVTLGSQTNHSEMMARAERVISL
jgi:hypothetical protein